MYIIDFDGTLVDIWNRYYTVFNDFWKISSLTLEEYKYLKREYELDSAIIKHLLGEIDAGTFERYKAFKGEHLEDMAYLKLDSLIVQKERLSSFFSENDAIILTIRTNKSNLIKQLNNLDIKGLAEKIIILDNNGKQTKKIWVENNIGKDISKIVIGDSEMDLYIGELENTRVILVETGLRNPIKTMNKLSIQGEIFSDVNCVINNV